VVWYPSLCGVCGTVSNYCFTAAKSAPKFGNKGVGSDEDIHNLICEICTSDYRWLDK